MRRGANRVEPRPGDSMTALGRRERDDMDRGGVFDGTVGWQDGQSHFDTNGNKNLVKVTLFEGHNASKSGPITDNRAHGHKITCRTSGPGHYIPPDGAQVHVSIPAGRWQTPGAPVIFAVPDDARFYAESTNFVRLKEDGSISLFTTADNTPNGQSVFFQVRPDGFVMKAPWGKFTFDKYGCHMLHVSGARFDFGAIGGLPAPLDSLGSYAKIGAAIVDLEGAAISSGTATGAADNVALATPTLAVLNAITVYITALNVALAALGSGGASPVTHAELGAIATALVAPGAPLTLAIAALAAAVSTLPSRTNLST